MRTVRDLMQGSWFIKRLLFEEVPLHSNLIKHWSSVNVEAWFALTIMEAYFPPTNGKAWYALMDFPCYTGHRAGLWIYMWWRGWIVEKQPGANKWTTTVTNQWKGFIFQDGRIKGEYFAYDELQVMKRSFMRRNQVRAGWRGRTHDLVILCMVCIIHCIVHCIVHLIPQHGCFFLSAWHAQYTA